MSAVFIAGVLFGWVALAVLVALVLGAVIAAADKTDLETSEDEADEFEPRWDVSA